MLLKFSQSDELNYKKEVTAKLGQLDGKTEEIQAELNRVVVEGMLNISISSGIAFNAGKSKGMANIYNVEANNYIF